MRLPAEWFLALRYLRPRRSMFSAITLLSVAGVVLGVAVLIVVLSVMSGFSDELERKIIGFNAHLVIDNGHIIRDAEGMAATIGEEPAVRAVTPYVQGRVVSRYQNERTGITRVTTPVLRGIPENLEGAAVELADKVRYGEFDIAGNGILVGRAWAARMQAQIGDTMLIYGPHHMPGMRAGLRRGPEPEGVATDGEPEPPRAEQVTTVSLPDEYVITGIFATGMEELDSEFFLTSLFNMQRLYDLGEGVHCISVKLDDADLVHVHETAQLLRGQLGDGINVSTWMDLNPDLFNAVAMERIVMAVLMFLIMIVAGFGLATTLITITVQKSREIGVLKALGAQDGQVMLIFSLHGLIVGFFGSLLGAAVGLFLVTYRNLFRGIIAEWTGIDVFPPAVYKFPEIPAVIQWDTNLLIILAAVAVCVLAALLPAYQASRLDPVKALRYE